MSLRVRIDDGGSHAGHRIVTEPKSPWTCSQGHANKGTWTRCMERGCNERRDG
jgi:hypothetical protein